MIKKNIIVVLGAPRSGTSAITRGLKALGIDIGDNLTSADLLWNPKGFWEDKDISNSINCGILKTLDCPWESLSIINKDDLLDNKLFSLKKLAIELLRQKMQLHTHWGFKDPRTAKLIPFWQEVFKELQLNDYYIITLRNPLAVALSYQKLRGFDLITALILWLMHIIPAIDETQQKKRVIISFEQMLMNPDLELERIRDFLQLKEMNFQELLFYKNQFLDKNFCHYAPSLNDLKNHSVASMIPLCLEVYELLSCHLHNLNSYEFMVDWQKIKIKFDMHYPMYIYLDILLKKNKKLTKDVRSMQRSFCWNLIYPLRTLEGQVRKLMQKKRQKRRIAKGSF